MDPLNAIFSALLVVVFVTGLGLIYAAGVRHLAAAMIGTLFLAMLVLNLVLLRR